MILFYKSSSIFFLSVVFITIGFILLFLFHVELYDQLTSEDNIIENLSAVLLLFCSCFFLISFFHARKSPLKIHHWLTYGLLMLSIVFFLIAGEEISWGQRIFDLATPDYLSSVNEQDELNFHNINKRFFDRLLDRATIIFVFISSFLLYRKKRKNPWNSKSGYFCHLLICNYSFLYSKYTTRFLSFYICSFSWSFRLCFKEQTKVIPLSFSIYINA